MIHVVLLGDSIFDNRAYVGGDPDVSSHLRTLAPPETKVSLCAVDGSTTENILAQAASVPASSTHLVMSVGGNDALAHLHVLTPNTGSGTQVWDYLAVSVEDFRLRYRVAVKALLALQKPVLLCLHFDHSPTASWCCTFVHREARFLSESRIEILRFLLGRDEHQAQNESTSTVHPIGLRRE